MYFCTRPKLTVCCTYNEVIPMNFLITFYLNSRDIPHRKRPMHKNRWFRLNLRYHSTRCNMAMELPYTNHPRNSRPVVMFLHFSRTSHDNSMLRKCFVCLQMATCHSILTTYFCNRRRWNFLLLSNFWFLIIFSPFELLHHIVARLRYLLPCDSCIHLHRRNRGCNIIIKEFVTNSEYFNKQ